MLLLLSCFIILFKRIFSRLLSKKSTRRVLIPQLFTKQELSDGLLWEVFQIYSDIQLDHAEEMEFEVPKVLDGCMRSSLPQVSFQFQRIKSVLSGLPEEHNARSTLGISM
jgi:hypothetical protein